MAVTYRTKADVKSQAGIETLLALLQHLPAFGLTLDTLAFSTTKFALGISAALPAGQAEHLGLEKV